MDRGNTFGLALVPVIMLLLAFSLSAGCVDQAQELTSQGVALAEAGLYYEAIDAFDQALEINPGYIPAWMNRGDAYRELGDPDEALVSYNRALAIDPGIFDARFISGMILLELGRSNDALDAFEDALTLDPLHTEAWNNRGQALIALGRFEDAVDSYDAALAIDPTYTDAWANRGIALSHLNRYDDAIASFDSALAIEPGNPGIWKARGIIQEDNGRYDEAIQSFQKALAIDPTDAEIWFKRGVMYEETGRVTEAITSFESAISINPDDADIWYHYGSALRKNGRFDEAISAYNRVLTIDPDYPGATVSEEEKNTWIVGAIVQEYYKSHTYSEIDFFVCTDMSIGVWNMIETRGINAVIAVGNIDDAAASPTQYNHAWVMAEIAPGTWLALETTGGFTVTRGNNRNYYQGFFFDNPREFKDYLDLMTRHNDQVERKRSIQDEYLDAYNTWKREVDYYNSLVDQLNAYVGRQLTHTEYQYATSLQQRIDTQRIVVEREKSRLETLESTLKREDAILQTLISQRPQKQYL